ncbi:ROK family protein [Paenibacillus sp. GCM10023248]|uniref:ROK family protein n=1 Tax=Bacillales TaxID=1385 RepID=UPI002377E045|nr:MULTISPECIES: ROK family protein [Bacillales]MDD9267381.1 ROK family protein [Paenibacillus sp. MAHUQ-63]MDR6882596.1 glucokinase [Bacillus sp. 3255]
MSLLLGGIDIGGTKCAAVLGTSTENSVQILDKIAFPTPGTPAEALAKLADALEQLLERHRGSLQAIGISCGGPLSSKDGLVLSPPNLPGWDRIDVCTPFRTRFGVPAGLQNDANACGLAEWKWGAGRGSQNMVFLTFGTGMGAGLILGGRLHAGANDMAGEVGHIRLTEDGPAGYGKNGSFEGYCSGGGIAKLAQQLLDNGGSAAAASSLGAGELSAKAVFEAAHAGDALALEAVRIVGKQLGRGLAILVDVLNPDTIVIGSIYERQESLLAPLVQEELAREALPLPLSVCRIVPSGLRDHVGDAASLSVALHEYELQRK